METVYEERVVCFIDALGFKSVIKRSESDVDVRTKLYYTLSGMTEEHFKSAVSRKFPYYDLGSTSYDPVEYSEVFPDDFVERLEDTFPLTITQFSDSFVLSCPSDNATSCRLLFKVLYLIHHMYFKELNMMVRGGITIGSIIHEEKGVLFGPAMNLAYGLESKFAIYPRVIIDRDSSDRIKELLCGSAELQAIGTSFDGFCFFDLISTLKRWSKVNVGTGLEILGRLKKMESDILDNSPEAHPKIKYLLTEWDKINPSCNGLSIT